MYAEDVLVFGIRSVDQEFALTQFRKDAGSLHGTDAKTQVTVLDLWTLQGLNQYIVLFVRQAVFLEQLGYCRFQDM